jgi:hypothetical protein
MLDNLFGGQKGVMEKLKGSDQTNNNFFEPINEWDPLVKKEQEKEYKFDCGMFNLGSEQDKEEYVEVVNRCVSGDYVMGIKQTNFNKEGDVVIYMEWVVPHIKEVKVGEQKPAKKKKKEEVPAEPKKDEDVLPENHFTTEPTLPFDLSADPHLVFDNVEGDDVE